MKNDIFVPEAMAVTKEAIQEFAEKNNIKTFADIEELKREAEIYFAADRSALLMVSMYAGCWEQEKEKELTRKCFTLLAEAEPTVSRASSILNFLKIDIEKTVVTIK